MKKTVFLMFMLLFSNIHAAEPEIQEIKQLFQASAKSKSAANQLLKLLADVTESSSPLLISYKGAAEMMQAKYAWSPVAKVKRFNTGKRLIETAVKKAPDHLEIRFLRFAIQTNLPAFLNYNDEIQNDKKFVLTHLKTTKDKTLKQNIVKYLSTSKYCTAEEKKALDLELLKHNNG
ncbi:hypothetical protein QG516_04270 [Pedobacter gandavensis]|uniref:hypothetical protein n=1 Tax=Pedobacter TaxID=84567 RepID=UPI001C9A29A2|nr:MULTISPECIES: hypothetical protein [Pedobacter]WGQ10868.1 hypothetical protein QG516_04270 [Pedobacter gandavensis]